MPAHKLYPDSTFPQVNFCSKCSMLIIIPQPTFAFLLVVDNLLMLCIPNRIIRRIIIILCVIVTCSSSCSGR